MLFIIIPNDNYCIFYFYRGELEFGEFESGFELECEFGTGMFGSIGFGDSPTQMSVLPAQMVIPTWCDVFYHIVNVNIY